MARALRRDVFESDVIGVYHCHNRIVRRSFLCGFDPHTKIDYSHRRDWLFQRLKSLAEHFAIDVLGYAILSNPSWLMRQSCQHMGIRCNREDEM